MKPLQAARIRAATGVVFALLGIGIGIELSLRPGPLSAKLLGIAFCAVLIALGIVRVRTYLKLKSELGV